VFLFIIKARRQKGHRPDALRNQPTSLPAQRTHRRVCYKMLLCTNPSAALHYQLFFPRLSHYHSPLLDPKKMPPPRNLTTTTLLLLRSLENFASRFMYKVTKLAVHTCFWNFLCCLFHRGFLLLMMIWLVCLCVFFRV